MTPELIISLISLIMSFASGIFTAFVTLKVGKLNNLEAIHKYQKKITLDELQFKSKDWFLKLMENDEFGNYDRNSQVIMLAWYNKLYAEETKKDQPKTTTKIRRIGRGYIDRFATLSKQGNNANKKISAESIMPNLDEAAYSIDFLALDELRNQYEADDITTEENNTIKPNKVELSYDDLLAANLEIKEDQ